MNTVVIKHVALTDLPAAWRARLSGAKNNRVTVRIEEEVEMEEDAAPEFAPPLTDNPLFGMWQDREEISDVAAYARSLRAPRHTTGG